MTFDLVLLQAAGDAVRDLVPPWLLPTFVAITRLGNVGLFVFLFTLDYWFVDRRRGAHAIAIIIGGMALITVLKSFFAVPRPPESVNVIPVSGFSFPSGHAMGSAIAYGTLAYDVDIGPRRVRYAVAGVVVSLIALSRVVLGVHFVRDIVFGVVFGLVFLAAVFTLTGHEPRPGFAVALVVAALAVLVSGGSQDSVVLVGAASGATLVWELVGDGDTVDRRQPRIALVALAMPVLAAVGYLAIEGTLPLPVVFVLSAALTGGIVGAPHVVDRVTPT